VIAIVLAILRRELMLASRIGGSGALALVFALTIVVLIPFALGPDLALLGRIAPAILWIAALLATLIGLDRLFQADEEDGSLDLMRASPAPLEIIVLAKVLAHWATTGLPLALAAPLFGLLLALPSETILPTVASLLIGTPALTFIGAVGAALTATIRRGGLVVAVTVAPLMVPVLIFGVATAGGAAAGGGRPFLVLLGLTLAAGAIGTVAAAAALRLSD
jgi:heme exporter protein B